MHCRCIDNNCHTVNDAVSVIERYEAILCNPQSTPVRALDVHDASQYESQILTAIQRLEAHIEHIEKVCSHCTPDQRSMPSRSQCGCFGCNSPSHFWRNCPKNVNNTFAANDQRNFVVPPRDLVEMIERIMTYVPLIPDHCPWSLMFHLVLTPVNQTRKTNCSWC
ncbi:hypothetical protein DPMN_053837 [Dreissena polymorpha]|uniref:CCHC-type domain-containing protein n=1 Tax=Dreissena polymorpha TaxID=45954 RepID=A0A9D4CNE6_DREPO|nr:hypothetical protein DPMN_053837 [Dreissena polymorpha]